MKTPEFISVNSIDLFSKPICPTILNVNHIVKMDQHDKFTSIHTVAGNFYVKETMQEILDQIYTWRD
jgi:uncharacterized protein YlzI (FlbEa/FlbD family)